MTGREAAEEQEWDKARQRRRVAVQAQNDNDNNNFWASQMVANIQACYSQSKTQLVPETQLLVLSQLSTTPSVELSLLEDSSSESTNEPRWSSRVKRPSRTAASQLSQDKVAALAAALTLAGSKGKGKGIKVRKTKSMNTSQLLDKFNLE
jgi:hypothetical protein